MPQKGDVIIYDQLSHASIRDGIRLSFADSFSFLHNDVDDLEKKLSAAAKPQQTFLLLPNLFFQWMVTWRRLKKYRNSVKNTMHY